MTKQQLAEEMFRNTTLTRSQALTAIEAFMYSATKAFLRGENIYLRRFGTFRIEQRKAKTARNISRGTSVLVPAHPAVKFRPSKELKALLK